MPANRPSVLIGSRRTHVIFKKGVGFIRRPVEVLGRLNCQNYRVKFLDTGKIQAVHEKRFERLAHQKSNLRIEAESAGFTGPNAIAKYIAFLSDARAYRVNSGRQRARKAFMESDSPAS